MKNNYQKDLPALDINKDLINKILAKKNLKMVNHGIPSNNGIWVQQTGKITDINLGEVYLDGYFYQPIIDYVKEQIGVTLLDPRDEIKVYTTTQGIAPHVDKFRLFTINIPINDIANNSTTMFYTDNTHETVDESFQYQDTPKMLNVLKCWHSVTASEGERRNMLMVSINPRYLADIKPEILEYFGYQDAVL